MKARPVFVTGATLALLLSACGGEGTTEGNGEENGDSSGGDFNIAWNAQPPTLDHLLTTANTTRDIVRNFYEPLLTVDADGEVQPVLAENYEVSEDGLTITFELREDVPFHDGTMMEAADVVASLERWIEHSNVGSLYFSEAIVDSPEDMIVTITLPEEMYVAPILLADQKQLPYIMPASIIEDAPAEGIQEYIGTGPYSFSEWSTDQYIRMDRFEEYSSPEGPTSGTAGAKQAHFDSLYYHFVTDDSTRVAGIQTGEYDAATHIPWDSAEVFEDDDNVDITQGAVGFGFSVFNHAEGVMADPDMRQAVLAAIDLEQLQQAAFGDEAYYNTSGALMPVESPWYTEVDNERLETQDLDDVQNLLDDAGYDGEVIRIMSTRDYDHIYDHSIMFQQQLENAGMNTELIVNDWPTTLESRDDLDGWEIYVTSDAWVGLPITYVFLSGSSWGGWATENEDIYEAANDLVYAADEEEAYGALAHLQDVFYEDLPVIKFGDYEQLNAMRSEFSGYEFTPESGAIYFNVGPAD